MKVILYMAATANGFIAKKDDDTSFVSKEEWDSYINAVKKAGNVIIGQRTYEIITKQPEFKQLENVKIIVLSRQDFKTSNQNHLAAKSPREALALAKDFEEVIVAGGASANKSFLEENLIDEIYLDVEPIIFGEGIPLFASGNFEKKLELIGIKNISNNEIQLHYRVEKN
ncbi:MAG: dihydrofolate reductase family protein [bacterium]|nr:dihydrofolate reductase family protein [bacterium]